MSALSTEKLRGAVPSGVRTLARVLSEAGFRAWAVGGCVRDELLATLFPERRAPAKNDWDIATDARPEQVQKLFRKVIPTGLQHGTVTVLLHGQSYEVTTLRGERGYSDGRRPDEVFFVSDLTEDLARRDFTVNAIAYDVLADTLHDPFDGIGDLRRRLLRAVGEPARRFAEDGLRVLRCARLSATLEMDIEEATRQAIRPSLGSFRQVSAERVRDEWFKALKAPRPSRAFEVMRDEGLLEITAPELTALTEVTLPGARSDALTTAFRTMDLLPPDPVLRFAGLVYPIGLIYALGLDQSIRGGNETPPDREAARGLASRLRLSNAERARIGGVVRHVPVRLDASVSDADLRRWLRDVTPERLDDVLTLEQARLQALEAPPSAALDALAVFRERAERTAASSPPLTIRDLAVTGRDLMEELALPPGPELGRLLSALLDVVLEDPTLNDKAALLARARELVSAQGS